MTDARPAVTAVPAGTRQVSRRTVVDADVDELFDLVADPHRHHEIDGSGTVRPDVKGPRRLEHGARFTVGMKQYGVPYRITSTVTRFEAGSVIEWQHPGRHRWRWEFAEASPGRTQVTETFDYRTALAPRALELLKLPGANARGITQTLTALQTRAWQRPA